MKKLNLKPCPFCGSPFDVRYIAPYSLGTAESGLYPGRPTYEITCSEPGCILGDWHYTADSGVIDDIITAINRRADR